MDQKTLIERLERKNSLLLKTIREKFHGDIDLAMPLLKVYLSQLIAISDYARENNFNGLEQEAKDSILNWYQRSSTIENRRDLACSGLVKI